MFGACALQHSVLARQVGSQVFRMEYQFPRGTTGTPYSGNQVEGTFRTVSVKQGVGVGTGVYLFPFLKNAVFRVRVRVDTNPNLTLTLKQHSNPRFTDTQFRTYYSISSEQSFFSKTSSTKAISYFNRNLHSLPENVPNVHADIQFERSISFFFLTCWYEE